MRSQKVILREVQRAQAMFGKCDDDIFGSKKRALLGLVFGLVWALGGAESPVERIIHGEPSVSKMRKKGTRARRSK